MALNMTITVFQNIMLYSLVDRHQFFGAEPVASTIMVVICHSTLKLDESWFLSTFGTYPPNYMVSHSRGP